MSLVRVERRDRIAILTADNPPVNALGHPLRAALADALAALAADPPRAAVLACAGRTFFAGADVREFGQPAKPPAIHELAAQIEALPFPVVAAMHGSALGGGLELALGCHGRVAAAETTLGFPEVTLGLIPGSGGVVRTARAVAPEEAAKLLTGGGRIAADRALALGLIDVVAEGDPVAQAVALAEKLARDMPVPLSQRAMPADPGAAFWQAQRKAVSRKARGADAPLVALDILRQSFGCGFDEARRTERAAFERLRDSEQAAALRHVFFAERQAAKAAKSDEGRDIARAGVVGGGTMGAGIATALLLSGVSVTLAETSGTAADAARERVARALDSAARRGLIDSAESALDRLATTTDYADFGDAELVVEAVFENLAVKRDVFARLSGAAPRDAVLATNTSYLDPRDIATAVDDPSRFIGIHFFSPAQIMKLVEIVPVPQTSAATRATAFRLVGRMGKVGIGAGICEGFIGNRILKRYRAAAETLLREGVPISDVDAAMRGFGMAMGPFEAQDLGGLDIAFQQREAAREAGGDVSGTLGDILVRAGRMGQKSGGGWYDYAEGDRTPRPSAETEDLLRGHIDAAAPRDADAIAARLVAEMAEEGAAIVAEGIAADPGQVDLVEIHGYGFPRWRGGPMFHAARMGLGALEVALGRAPSEALSKLGMG